LQIIKELRQERGLSQQRLAELAEVDKVTLIRIETGRGNPTVETLGKLADALDVEMADLFPKAQTPLFPELPDTAAQEEKRRAEWDAAIRNAHQVRERGHARMEGLLSAWRTSKARGEVQDARRDYLDEMGELLQQAYDAEWALWALISGPTNALDLNAVDPDEFTELQAADRFYVDLWRMVQRAEGLSIRTDAEETTGTPETVNAGDSPPAARPEEVVELEAA
jgi:transcriptional regulator with XRE-family HTH domain